MRQDDRALPVRGERALERGLRLIGQLVVDHDRNDELGRGVEDLAEHGPIGVAIDQPPADLPHVDLADHARLPTLQLDRELARGALGRRLWQGQPRDHAVGILLARRRQPGGVVLLQAADAQ